MGIHNYFKSLSDLEMINRCPGKYKHQEHSVASHSFKVTTIAQFLATVEEHEGNAVDWKVLFEKTINHDYAELFTGDIKTPVKYASQELRELFAEVEREMTQKFLEQEIPAEFRADYERRLQEGKDDSLEGKILAVADKIDLLYEAFGEIQKGNPDQLFREICQEALASISHYQELACVQYFLDHVLSEMMAEDLSLRVQTEQIKELLLAHVRHTDTP